MNSPCSTTPGMEANDCRQLRRIGYAAEMGIDDPVATIGDENVTIPAFPDHHLSGNAAFRKRLPDRALRRGQPERNDLDGQRKTAERLDPFGVVGDHDHAVGRRGNDLFPQQARRRRP